MKFHHFCKRVFLVGCWVMAGNLLLSFSALAQGQNQARPNETGRMTLALDNADIRDLISWAQEVTDKTIIVHPNVKGKVTVKSGQALSADEVYHVFLSVLQVHGFAAIPQGNTLKIIPDALAKQTAIPLIGTDNAQAGESVVVQIVKIRNVSATQLINLLRPLVPQVGHLAAYPATNSLIIADRSSNIDKVLKIIKRIDQVGVVDIELLSLQFASAQDAVEVINKLLPKISSKDAASASGIRLAVDERSNSILLTGDPAMRQQIRNLVQRLDQPLAGDGNTQVIYLSYAKAVDVAPILEGISGSAKKTERNQGKVEVEVSIQSNEALNALIITAPPSLLTTMKGVIAKLDVRRAQVLVEALIVEVSEGFGRDLGVNWRTTGSDDVRSGFFPGSTGEATFGGDANAFAFPTGLSVGYFPGGELRALINTLATDTNTNILSTPTIMALDNEEAEILVGENVPFVTGSQLGDNNSNPFTTVQRQDIGISLKIKAHINNDNSVTLEIEQKTEDVLGTVGPTGDLRTSKREIKTTVLIGDKETLVLGGLISDKVTETENKIPLLGDIPVLGHLFKSTSATTTKTNLMVFIQPTILSEVGSGDSITRKHYNSLQGLQKNFTNKVETFFVPRPVPVLSDLSSNSPELSENNSPEPNQ